MCAVSFFTAVPNDRPFRRQYDGVLNYYQGYHDVVTVLLLVTGDTQLTYALTERASHYFFR